MSYEIRKCVCPPDGVDPECGAHHKAVLFPHDLKVSSVSACAHFGCARSHPHVHIEPPHAPKNCWAPPHTYPSSDHPFVAGAEGVYGSGNLYIPISQKAPEPESVESLILTKLPMTDKTWMLILLCGHWVTSTSSLPPVTHSDNQKWSSWVCPACTIAKASR